jgi:hypothetical protein
MLVALAAYRAALALDAVRHQLETGEKTPGSALRAQACAELGLDEDQLMLFSYAGEMVRWERELSLLSDEERAERLAEFAEAQRELDQATTQDSEAQKRAAETEMLKRMFED